MWKYKIIRWCNHILVNLSDDLSALVIVALYTGSKLDGRIISPPNLLMQKKILQSVYMKHIESMNMKHVRSFSSTSINSAIRAHNFIGSKFRNCCQKSMQMEIIFN